MRQGDIILYHGSNSWLSRFIAWGQKRVWHKTIMKDIAGELVALPPPSHALIAIGDNICVEADWGHPLNPFKRDGGVRKVSIAKMKKRSGYHTVWRTRANNTNARTQAVSLALKAVQEKSRYDFIGLLSVALFLRNLIPWSIHSRKRFFCSELAAHCYRTPDAQDVSPAMLPDTLDLTFVSRL